MTQPVYPQPPNVAIVGTPGPPGPSATVVSARTGLTSLADALMTDGALAFNTEAGYRARWRLDQKSALAADGVTVVPTASGVGKWVLDSRYSGSVPVTECGADPTATSSAVAAFQALANALSGTGVDVFVASGIYKFDAVFNVPSNLRIFAKYSTATIKAALTPTGGPGGFTQCPFFATQGAITATTTLASTPAKESKTLSVASATGISNGSILIVVRTGTLGQVEQQFTVLSGGGTTTLGVDVPTEFSFQSGDTVNVVASVPTNITIEGLIFSGPCDRHIELAAARGCKILFCDSVPTYGAPTAMGMSFDVCGRDNLYDTVKVNGGGVTQGSGLSFETQVRSVMRNCRAWGVTGAAAGQGLFLDACQRCVVESTHAWQNGTGTSGLGCGLGPAAPGDTDGCQHNSIIGCSFYDNAGNGLVMTGGQNNSVVASHLDGNANDGLLAIDELNFKGSALTCNSNGGNGVELQLSATGCLNFQVDGLTANDCTGAGFYWTSSHRIQISNYTSDRCARAIYANGMGVCTVDGFFSEDSTPLITFGAAAEMTIKRGHVRKLNSTAYWAINFAAGAKLSLDDVVFEQAGGSGTSAIVDIESAGAFVWMRNVRTIGGMSNGVYVGVSGSTVKIDFGCDFTSSAAPITLTAGSTLTQTQGEGLYTDATTTGTVSLTHVQAKSSGAKFAQSLTGNLTYNVPAGAPGLWNVDTSGVTLNGHTFSVGVVGGAAVSLTAGQHLVYSDGTNMHTVV